MQVIDDAIDFDAYLKGTDENAKVRPASEYAEAVIDRIYSPDSTASGCSLPWKKADNLIGLRSGEVSLWNGYNGSGKSMVLGQIATSLMNQGERVCIASMEMRPAATVQRMMRQAAGGMPTREYIRDFAKWTDGKLWLYDQLGTVSADRILGVIRYAATELKVTHCIIDSLMKCGIDEDDMNRQKRFLDQLCAAAKDTSAHIHLVTHARKSENELDAPGKMSVKGSGSITDQSDNVFSVWRNKRKEKAIEEGKADQALLDAPDTYLICDKQRHGEWEGKIGLWFDKGSFRYKNGSQDAVMAFQVQSNNERG